MKMIPIIIAMILCSNVLILILFISNHIFIKSKPVEAFPGIPFPINDIILISSVIIYNGVQ